MSRIFAVSINEYFSAVTILFKIYVPGVLL